MIKPKTKKGISSKKGGKKNKPKTIYDWDAIKQQFFESDFIDVAPFLQLKYGLNTVDSGNAQQKTKWWWEEKKQIADELRRKALEDFKTNIRKQWEVVYDKLEQAHVRWLENLTEMILDQGKISKRKTLKETKDKETGTYFTETIEVDHMQPYLQQFDMIAILKHIKLEKWEPTDIVDTGLQSKSRAWLEEMKKEKAKKGKGEDVAK